MKTILISEQITQDRLKIEQLEGIDGKAQLTISFKKNFCVIHLNKKETQKLYQFIQKNCKLKNIALPFLL